MSGGRKPDDIESEIEFHFQETIDALVASGATEDEARHEARRRYGDRARFDAAIRAAHRRRWARSIWRPARHAMTVVEEARWAGRALRRAPGYALTAILTLALVTGANLTMFGIADGLIARPLRYLRDAGAVHRVYWQWRDRAQTTTSASTQFARFVDLQRDASSFTAIAVFAERSVPVGDGDQARQQKIAAVSASYFDLFDAQPVRGRFFAGHEDVVPRGADVVVLGHRFWRTQMGAREVLGDILRIGDMRATIVGIAPPGFDGLNDGDPPAAFVPVTSYAASTGTDDARTYFSAYRWGWVHVLVRRAPGVTIETAGADATRTFRSSWPRSMLDNASLRPLSEADPRAILSSVRTGGGPTRGLEARTSLWLSGVAAAVLLIGCANVAALSLTRALGRRHHINLKRALGVSRLRLGLATGAEAVLLAVAGGVGGLVLAHLIRSGLAPVLRTLKLAEVSVFTDPRTLVVTAVLSALATLVIAATPLLARARSQGNDVLRGSTRTAAPGGRRLRGVLLSAQAALSVVLLVAAALFVRSLIAVTAAPMGYDPSRVLIVNRLLSAGALDPAQHRVLREDLLQAARTNPGVEAAAWMSSAPFVSTSWTDLFVDGLADASSLGPFTFQATTPDYFQTMGTRIVQGRSFTSDHGLGAPEVAVVSESMARTLWPGGNAIGSCFRMRQAVSPCRTVIGIAEDIVQRTLEDGPRLHYYVPIDQYPRTSGNGLLLRLREDPVRTGEAVRAALQATMPAGSYLVAQPLAVVVNAQQGSWRMGAAILTGFGALALLVASVGLYGAVGYDITERRREWAVRVALGADRRSIVATVAWRSFRLIAGGVALGLLFAGGGSRWIQPLLFHTSATDPLAYAVVATMMLGVVAVASVGPAIGAAAADPNDALKSD